MAACGHAVAADAEAALTFARQNNCFRCHHMDKTKEGPSFRRVAKLFHDKPDAEAALIRHFTTGPAIELSDGSEERHKILPSGTPGERAQLRNLAQFLLSLPPQ